MHIILRDATEADKEFLYILNRVAYQHVVIQQFGKWDENWQRDYFNKKWSRARYRIIEYEETSVGTIWITPHPDHIFLNEIQIVPAHQNHGIGSQVILRELERAHAQGKPVRLHVLKKNLRAQALYERLGFVIEGYTDTHICMTH